MGGEGPDGPQLPPLQHVQGDPWIGESGDHRVWRMACAGKNVLLFLPCASHLHAHGLGYGHERY
jgi:hypothetical protein